MVAKGAASVANESQWVQENIVDPNTAGKKAAKEVAVTSAVCVAEMYGALLDAGKRVVHAGAEASSNMVRHRYGDEAGEVAQDTTGAVKDLALAGLSVSVLSATAAAPSLLAVGTAKRGAREVLLQDKAAAVSVLDLGITGSCGILDERSAAEVMLSFEVELVRAYTEATDEGIAGFICPSCKRAYASPNELELHFDRCDNTAGIGLGIEYDNVTQVCRVVAMAPGGPAELSGKIHLGQRLLKIDGLEFHSFDAARERIQGPHGSKLTLTLADPPNLR
jgi:hypothetical protein